MTTVSIKEKAISYRNDARRFSDAVKTGNCPPGEADSWIRFSQIYRIVADELDGVAKQLREGKGECSVSDVSTDGVTVFDCRETING